VCPTDEFEIERDELTPVEVESGSLVAQISRDIVRVHSQFYGRGPTKSKTIYREGVVTCILGEIFTKAEATLVRAGQFEQVRASRQAFQDTVEPLLRQAVEEATGRRVLAFFSQVSEEDYAAEVFVLGQGETAEP
jgi:uncharacterized protein YbcI